MAEKYTQLYMSDQKQPRPSHLLQSPPLSPPRESIHSLDINTREAKQILCCGRQSDPRLLSFSVKVGISILVLAFSFYKIYKIVPCSCTDDTAVWVGVISSILAYWTGYKTSG